METKKQMRIDSAEQQLTGFALGSQGYSIIELIRSMNLKEEEWMHLKAEGLVNNLTENQIEEIDEDFRK